MQQTGLFRRHVARGADRLVAHGLVEPCAAGEPEVDENRTIDGALVGGASLDPESFATIVESARP